MRRYTAEIRTLVHIEAENIAKATDVAKKLRVIGFGSGMRKSRKDRQWIGWRASEVATKRTVRRFQ